VTNDNNIDFVASGGSWAVTAMGIHSLVTAGVFYMWDALASTVTINDGETGRFAASSGITITLD
jgi:hypothetical protein